MTRAAQGGAAATLDDTLAPALHARRTQRRYRRRPLLGASQAVRTRLDGRDVLAFSSNDYLGLAAHPRVTAAFREAAERYGVGSGASHLICGHSVEHHALEEELADFCGRPRALLFSSGYMANTGTIAALVGRGDQVVQDRLNHASLLDGGLLSGARFRRYAHNNPEALDSRLRDDAPRSLVVTDGVFSMDGDLARLPDLARVCRRRGAWLMVDDAHGFGVLGEGGAGTLEHFGLGGEDVPVLMGTLGKALGTGGAFVAGSETLVEYLIQFCRPYIYTTAMPAATAAATRAALALVREEPWRRERLRALVARFRAGVARLGLELMDSPTPIQPVLVGTEGDCLALADSLWRRGIHVGAIRPPTVPEGGARLRITFSAAHRETDVDQLLEALASALEEAEV